MLKDIAAFLFLYGLLLLLNTCLYKDKGRGLHDCENHICVERGILFHQIQFTVKSENEKVTQPTTHIPEPTHLLNIWPNNITVGDRQINSFIQRGMLPTPTNQVKVTRLVPSTPYTEEYGLLIDMVPSSISVTSAAVLKIGSMQPIFSTHLSDMWDMKNYQFSRERWYAAFLFFINFREPSFTQLLDLTHKKYEQR